MDEVKGTWELKRSEMKLADGTTVFPLGKGCQGILTMDGTNLNAQLMRPGRPEFSKDDLFQGEEEEIRTAYSGYLSFWGKYEISGDNLTYVVDGCIFPNWIGKPQQRTVVMDGNTMILKTPPIKTEGGEITSELVWQRVK